MANGDHVELPASVNNFHVANLCNTATTFVAELIQSASARQARFTVPDLERVNAFIQHAQALVDFYGDEGRNDLDMPKIHGRQFPLEPIIPPDDEQHVAVTNPMVQQTLYYWEAIRYEMAHSQSAGMTAGLGVHDFERAHALLDDMIAYLDEIVESDNPLDFPVSASAEGVDTGQ